jgi:hypothetical protein
MIEGFEDITFDLTDHEKNVLVPLFIKGFQKKIGRKNAVTARQISKALKDNFSHKVDGPRIRKIVNFIRMNWLVPGLVATSQGYYIETDKEEVSKYVRSLTGRIEAIKAIRQKFIDYDLTM